MTKIELIEEYRNATNRLILLDYDGTLVGHVPDADKALPSVRLLDILKRLIHKPQTKVIIITGRRYKEIDKFLGHLPIDIIAEHGAMLKENGVWVKQANDSAFWMKLFIPLIKEITATCPESFIEVKDFSITWHYRKTDQKLGYTHSRKLISYLETLIDLYNLKVLDGNKVLEIMSKEIGKGKASEMIIDQNDYDYILSIGDDMTDEEMFKVFLNNPNASTVKVGNSPTYAKQKLENVDSVIKLLEKLAYCD